MTCSDASRECNTQSSARQAPPAHAELLPAAPVPEPTIRTGVKAMTSAVLELLKK
jgi:hypothetical protein